MATASETFPRHHRKTRLHTDLGCNAIWLNPCFDSPFKDAGYDVRDYKKVAPRYGTNDDLAALFAAAHERGMHVILDLVPGHTSEEQRMVPPQRRGGSQRVFRPLHLDGFLDFRR